MSVAAPCARTHPVEHLLHHRLHFGIGIARHLLLHLIFHGFAKVASGAQRYEGNRGHNRVDKNPNAPASAPTLIPMPGVISVPGTRF